MNQNNHVCPWWMAYTFDNPLRKFFHNPQKMFSKYLNEDSIVMDIGCGMGYFSIGIAKLLGSNGKVISVDIQDKMLQILTQRAKRNNVSDKIVIHKSNSKNINLQEKVDFILMFWMFHESPDMIGLLKQAKNLLKHNGKILIAEPKLHVSDDLFQETIDIATSIDLQITEKPEIPLSRSIILSHKKKN